MLGGRYRIVDKRLSSTIYRVKTSDIDPRCVQTVETEIPVPAPAPLWQYISLPRGGVRGTGSAAGTLRTGYCGEGHTVIQYVRRRTNTLDHLLIQCEPVRLYIERRLPFQEHTLHDRWIRVSDELAGSGRERRPSDAKFSNGLISRDPPRAPRSDWTESSILAQDERWRRA